MVQYDISYFAYLNFPFALKNIFFFFFLFFFLLLFKFILPDYETFHNRVLAAHLQPVNLSKTGLSDIGNQRRTNAILREEAFLKSGEDGTVISIDNTVAKETYDFGAAAKKHAIASQEYVDVLSKTLAATYLHEAEGLLPAQPRNVIEFQVPLYL